MTDKSKITDNAIPGTFRDFYFTEEEIPSDRFSDGGGGNSTGLQEEYNNQEKAATKEESRKRNDNVDDETTCDKIKEIENTLDTLGSLIEEYGSNQEKEDNDEMVSDAGPSKMEVEAERAGKRKKESPPEVENGNVSDDSDRNIRPVKRASVKSKIDTSLPIYKIDSSSANEGTSNVEIMGMQTGSEKKKKTKETKRLKRKSTGSLDLNIKEIKDFEGHGNYDNMSAPTMGWNG